MISPAQACLYRGRGAGIISAGENFGRGLWFFRVVRNPGHFLLPASAANPFLLQGGTGARVLHARISLYASAYPKNFFFCIPKNDFVYPVCIPKDFFVYPLCISATVHKAPKFGGDLGAEIPALPPPRRRLTVRRHRCPHVPSGSPVVHVCCAAQEKVLEVRWATYVWIRGTAPIHWKSQMNVGEAEIIIPADPFDGVQHYYRRLQKRCVRVAVQGGTQGHAAAV